MNIGNMSCSLGEKIRAVVEVLIVCICNSVYELGDLVILNCNTQNNCTLNM